MRIPRTSCPSAFDGELRAMKMRKGVREVLLVFDDRTMNPSWIELPKGYDPVIIGPKDKQGIRHPPPPSRPLPLNWLFVS